MKAFLLLAAALFMLQTAIAQTSYTWNGSVSSSWTTPGNWTPNGIPGGADDVKIVTAGNICILNATTTINNIDLTSGTLDLNSATLTINGPSALFTSGTVQNGNVVVSSANTTRFGTGTVTMNCSVQIAASTISIRNTTFQGVVDITKTGSSHDGSNGNNIFNGSSTITNAGSGALVLASTGGDQFYNSATFNNTGSSYMHVAYNSSNNLFAGVATFNNAPSNNNGIYIGWYSPGVLFNDNIVVNSTSGSGVQFCGGNVTASAILAAGYTISVGANGFTSGRLYLKQFTQSGSAPVTLSTTATSEVWLGPSGNFGGAVTISSPNIYASTAVFNSPVILTKTDGTASNTSSGGNTFNADLTVNYFSSTGTGYWSFANGLPDVYNGNVYSNNNSLDRIIFGHNSANNQFNGNFIITQTGSSRGTALSWNNTASSVMAAGKTISIGGAGFSTGYFYIQGFTQNGNMPIHLNTTGSSAIYTGAGISNNPSVIGGDFSVVAADIYVRGTTFNGEVTITKTGGVSNHNDGKQNIFNGTLFINQQSSTGYFMLGYNSNDQFNDDIIVSSTGSGDINFGYSSGSGTPTLAAGKTIQIGSAGYSDGMLSLNSFTQYGNAPLNLAFTGTHSAIRFARNTVIGGNLVVSSPNIYFDGCTFNGTVDATKTGSGSNAGRGGNIFNKHCNITSSGSGYLLLGNVDADIWNDDAVFTNNGSERILPCWASTGNQFNGNIFLNTTGSADGIHFCGGNSTATATLAAGKTIQAGSSGLNAGYIILKQFTQLGSAPINLSLHTTATYLQFGPSSFIGGNVTAVSPGLYFYGCTFSGMVNTTKTGTTNDASVGNNIFNGNTTITNAGAGYLLLGNGNADQFNNAATFNNTGSNNIHVAYNSSNNVFGGVTTFNNATVGNTGIYVGAYSAGTKFNENIVVSSTGGQGVQFCIGNTTAAATLASGKTISVGSAGFTAGTLLLKQFTQLGTTAQHFALTGTGRLTFGPSSAFGGTVTSTSPSLVFSGCTFNDVVNSTKTGATNDQSTGNNIFTGSSVFNNTGTGYLMMSISSPDIYKGNVSFIKSNTGFVYPNYNHSSTYAGDINTSSATAVTFGAGTGTAILNGTGTQNISVTPGTPTPVFTRLEVKNTGSGVTLNNTPIDVSRSLVLTSGLLHTSVTNILTMQNTSTVAAGNALSTSYVNGPMRYQKSSTGSSILNFPVGNGSDCRPVSLTVNHSNAVLYTYQTQLFNASAAALGYTLPPLTDSVSPVHYYTIARTDALGNNQPVAGLSGNQTIEIFFGSNDLITDGGRITVVKNTYNNPTSWVDIGGIGGPPYAGGVNLTGSITSTSAPTAFNSFSTFAIGFRRLMILPVNLDDFAAKPNNNVVDIEWTTAAESGNQFFTIERSMDGTDFEFVKNVRTKANGGNSQVKINYAASDNHPYTGRSYYRIKQTDINGKFSYTKMVPVNFEKKTSVTVYPNPAANTIYINGLKTNTTQVEWYDIGGRMLVTQLVPVQNGIARVSSNLTEGIYILKYTTANGVWGSQRIIIRR